ncbi:hypothetical protein [Alkalimarinus alittae]|uniref:Uncharacterized protein n=1 Tax=Alkalimarinus alittae TaxID=2961619 RepID=A0ABY6MX16_9ALTE|nr:hypothetical protein [Alkalimarinus alittae]UZE94370.1 hypothetical protein NKI27_09705 [Alkalimarinus alittae]
MATPVTSILIIASTSTAQYATSQQFSGITIPQVAAAEIRLSSTQSGGSTAVTIPASGSKNLEDITPADITINVEPPKEGDAWLPSSLCVLGKGDTGDYQIICNIPAWPPQIWLSADKNDHQYPDAFSSINLEQVIQACNK